MFPFLRRYRNGRFLFYSMIQNLPDNLNESALPDLIVLIVFIVLYVARMLYLFLFPGKILFKKQVVKKTTAPVPLSLIMAIRNEEENLKKNLPRLLSLEKSDFEVVAVDDFSQDNSYTVLGVLKDKYKRLTISALNEETRFSTKLSQNIALKSAKNDWVILVPVSLNGISEEWLETFSKTINNEMNIVTGYSGINRSKNIFNLLYRIENFFQQLKSTGYILNHLPFVYSEENIAFQKKMYFENGGYGKNLNELYANLELIINSFIEEKTTHVLFDRQSAIYKNIEVSRKDYFELLKKSFRIEKHLSKSKKLFLAADEWTKVLFIPSAIVAFFLNTELWPLFVIMFFLKLPANLLIIKNIQDRLNERKIYVSSLIYDIVVPYIRIICKWHYHWRRRK